MFRKLALSIVAAIVLLTGAAVGFYYAPVYIAKEAVKLELNDPDSAQFRNVRRVSRLSVCGEVNARNRMGGYVGFTKFYVLNTALVGLDGYFHVLRGVSKDDAVVTIVNENAVSELGRQLAAIDSEHVKKTCDEKQ